MFHLLVGLLIGGGNAVTDGKARLIRVESIGDIVDSFIMAVLEAVNERREDGRLSRI